MSDHRPVKASFTVTLEVLQAEKSKEKGGDQNVAMGQQGRERKGAMIEKKKKEQEEEIEQPVGISESLLGVARSQVCRIQ
jgi:hypothetical protein